MTVRPAMRQVGRLSEIAQAAARHGFGYFLDNRRLGVLRRRQEPSAADGHGTPRAERLRALLDELGPTFVKFGQLLSTRPDIVPPDIVLELKELQDNAQPVPLEDIERVLREDLGLSSEQLFLEFDPRPVAAASIGQVHRAVLPNGHEVAVKIQRLDARRQIEADLELLAQLARMARERVRALELVDPVALVDELGRSIRQELDYRLEARNAQRFRRHFAGDPRVRIPRVYPSYSSGRVLTLEYLAGKHLGDVDLTVSAVPERCSLAYAVTQTWMEMIFRHGFFHGDPHPSNILVLDEWVEGEEGLRHPRLGLIDFGVAGSLSGDDMGKLTGLFLDAVQENVEALPRRLQALNVRYPKGLEQQFVLELRELYHRYYGARLNDVDPLQLIREVFGLVYRMQLRLPTRFVLLGRAVATVGSVGMELYPELNVFEVARPYARELLLERFSPGRVALRARQEARNLGQMLLALPYQVHDVLEEARDGELEVQFRHRGLDDLIHRLDLVFNRVVIALIAVGGTVGSSLIGIFAEGGPRILGLHLVSIGGFTLSALLGVWLVWAVIRSGRL